MEEIKIIIETLIKMGTGAQTAFIVWCIKEIIIFAFVPLTFLGLGYTRYKMHKNWINKSEK